ncbi:MAG: hypothetical protein N2037_05885, partial [Acidimicrobiales bacterium]|nr:hypothetical protein [Acidimicrobiales bacterium]
MASKDEWRKAFEQAPLRDAEFTTLSGIPLEPVYGPTASIEHGSITAASGDESDERERQGRVDEQLEPPAAIGW